MKQLLSKMSVNQKFAAIALLLGAFALVAGNPYQGAYAKINSKDLAVMVNNEVDHVTVDELADWIIKAKLDFRLIDLRTEKEFAEYHIPQAENIQITNLMYQGLQRSEKIVLYSEGGIHSAQAWFLLTAHDYKGVYMLRGGLEEWNEKILFPSLAMNATPDERALFEKKKEISRYFGGTPQSGATKESITTIAMPKMSSPAVTATPAGGKKKKKEGC